MNWRPQFPSHGFVAAAAAAEDRHLRACSIASFHCGELDVPVAEASDLAFAAVVAADGCAEAGFVAVVAGWDAAAAAAEIVAVAGQGVSFRMPWSDAGDSSSQL